jgi:hypothetical protein
MGPQYDWIYLRCLLELGRIEGTGRWSLAAQRHADAALSNAAVGDLWLRAWDGSAMTGHDSYDDMLQTHAATTALLAWLAADG